MFLGFGTCLDCKRSINLEKICDELLSKNLDKNNRFRCECGKWNMQKLNFKIGTELYNQVITTNHSSIKEGVILYSPTNLKKKLLDISYTLKDKEFDVDNFRLKYPEEFWNSIWYFKLKDIDISFMLPYITPVYINIISNEKENNIINNINNNIKFAFEDDRMNKAFQFKNNNKKF